VLASIGRSWRRCNEAARLHWCHTLSLGPACRSVARWFVGHSVSAGELPLNGFPTDADFFPIGVWAQSPARAASYKAIGINTFVGLDEGLTEEQLATLAHQDMFAVAAQNDIGLKSVSQLSNSLAER
jgi:hypothetical protein